MQCIWKCIHDKRNNKYKIKIRERGEISIYNHQIEKYIINSLNFPLMKSEIIRQYNNKADITIVKSKKNSQSPTVKIKTI